MIYVQPGATFEALLTGSTPGLLGVLTVELYDPTDGTSIIAPDTVGITEPRPGTYRVALEAPAIAGSYLIRWDAGADVAEEEVEVTTAPPPDAPDPIVGPLLATVDQLKAYLRAEGTAGSGAGIPDGRLESMLAGASSRMTEARPERTLIPVPASPLDPPVALTFPARRVIQVPDLREVVSITVGDRVLANGDFVLRRRPREACALWINLKTAPWGGWGNEVVIEGRWGPAGAKIGEPLDVRADIRDACLVWAARAFHNAQARYSDTQQDPAGGVASYFRNLPPDVKLVLDGLEVPGI